ncbi:hypothetical protein [Streptomyces sp. NPDC127100]|uniref:hypothetical protein n=1 Tax=Streptomyces sp. NPDC127100 TaxID=3347138 RepID=UPI00365CAB98
MFLPNENIFQHDCKNPLKRNQPAADKRIPCMAIYNEEEDGPSMLLRLPVSVVEKLAEIAYRHITPSMGLDGAFVDELRFQLADNRAHEG